MAILVGLLACAFLASLPYLQLWSYEAEEKKWAEFYAQCRPVKSEMDSPVRQGLAIKNALESYFSTHQTYPSALAELVPDYLAEIPSPEWGDNDWGYETKRGNGYSMAVMCGENDGIYLVYFFSSSNPKWSEIMD